MASVKIDLGFGEHAILSEQAGFGAPTARQRSDAEQFLRRWPRTRSIEQERDYLRQLRLHVGSNPPGATSSDTSEQLRAAVKSGKVTVVIERAAAGAGGGISAPGPTRPPYPLSERVKTTWVPPTRKSSYADDRPPRYDDVSADDLINYIQGVLGTTPVDATATDVAPSTLLGDAQPFDYSEDSASDDAIQLAGGEGTPGNNQAQNKQFKAVVRALGLNQDQARRLHEEISGEGLGYQEMLERGQDMFGDIE